MSDFLAMGGYAPWVWSAFGMTVIVLVGNVIMAGRRYRQVVKTLQGRLGQLRERAGA